MKTEHTLIQKRKKKNLFLDKAFFILVLILSFSVVVPLLVILSTIVVNGISAVNWELITTLSDPLTGSGGIFHGIVGSLLMVLVATVIAVPIGVMAGIYLSENTKGKIAGSVRIAVDVLQGVPSIIIGVVVFTLFMKRYSGFAGSVALSIMMLPVVIKNTEETLKLIPLAIREAAYALGVPYHKVMLRVILPAGLSGIATGVLVSISRIAGETAPLLFTAMGSPFLNANLTKPTSAVPLLIWESYSLPNALNIVWGASFVLVTFILVLNIIAKVVVNKWKVKF